MELVGNGMVGGIIQGFFVPSDAETKLLPKAVNIKASQQSNVRQLKKTQLFSLKLLVTFLFAAFDSDIFVFSSVSTVV